VYFGFRSGSLIVLPLSCKRLLQDELGGELHSPLYQVPLALWFVMDMLIAAPNALFMQRYGRRLGFMIGSSCGVAASCGAFFVLRFLGHRVWLAFVLLNVVVVLMSVIGMAEFVRFAAAEACADDGRRSKVVSRVISGGAILSMVGPFSASAGELFDDGHELSGFANFFLFTAGFGMIALIAASALRLPPAAGRGSPSETPICQILKRPKVWSAIFAQVAVQFAMVAPMSATPLRMDHTVAAPDEPASFFVSCCIVAHVLAMFIPGFFTGSAIALFGVFPIMFAGILIQCAGGTVLLIQSAWTNFYVGLVLIGLGWNLAFVSGTMLLLESHTAEERTKVTSANETLRFMSNCLAVLLSSTLQWMPLLTISMSSALLASLVILRAQVAVVRATE